MVFLVLVIKGLMEAWKVWARTKALAPISSVTPEHSYDDDLHVALQRKQYALASRLIWKQFLSQHRLPTSMTPLEFNFLKNNLSSEISIIYKAMYTPTNNLDSFLYYQNVLKKIAGHE